MQILQQTLIKVYEICIPSIPVRSNKMLLITFFTLNYYYLFMPPSTSDKKLSAINHLIKQGKTQREIVKQENISFSTIQKAKNR